MGVKLDFSLLLFMCIFSVNACMLWSFIISRFPHQGSLVSLSFQGLNGALLMGKRYSTVFGGGNPNEMVSERCLSYKQERVIYNF